MIHSGHLYSIRHPLVSKIIQAYKNNSDDILVKFSDVTKSAGNDDELKDIFKKKN